MRGTLHLRVQRWHMPLSPIVSGYGNHSFDAQERAPYRLGRMSFGERIALLRAAIAVIFDVLSHY
jgi:hypothetical protein